MRIVDFTGILRETINDKINECQGDIHEFHNHIDKDRLMIKIHALEWPRGHISDLVVNKERKEKSHVIT
jgi:hypothetical protein